MIVSRFALYHSRRRDGLEDLGIKNEGRIWQQLLDHHRYQFYG